MVAGAGGIRAGQAFVELFLKNNMTRELDRASGQLQAFGRGVTAMGEKVAVAGGAITSALGGALHLFAEVGDNLTNVSKRTGASVESLSSLGYAAEQSGVSAEELGHSFAHMSRTLAEAAGGSAEATKALDELGLSVQQLQGLKAEDRFRVIGDRLSKVADPAQRAAAAMGIFGRAGAELLPMFDGGAEGLARLEARARELGLVMSGADAASARTFSVAFRDLMLVLRQSAIQIGAALAPELTRLVGWLTKGAVTVLNFVKENKQLILTVAGIAAGVTAAGAALAALGGAASAIGAAFAGLSSIVGAATAVLTALLTPIGLVVTALTAITAAVLYFTGAGGKALGWLGEQAVVVAAKVTEAWGGIKDALSAGDLALAAKVAWTAIRAAALENTVGIQKAWVNLSSDVQVVWAEVVAFVTKGFVTLGAYAAEWVARAIGQWQMIQAFAQGAWDTILATFKPVVDTLATVWENFVNGFMKAWNLAIGFLAKKMAPLLAAAQKLGIAGAGTLAVGVTAAVGPAQVAHVARAGEQAAGMRAGAEEQLQKELTRIEEERQRRLAGVDEGVVKAKQDYQNALAEAADAAETARKKALAGAGEPGAVPTLPEVQRQAQSRVEVTGTFSALAAGQMGSSKVADQIAEHTKDMVSEQKKTNKMLQEGIGLKAS
jgi:hypothetical protein